MIQGTTSDAGKSVMVAGLCRLLKRRGFRVAPFKPQNMALNSAVTVDGGEIGRAQALQAQACGLDPHTDMNPILLKPSSDTGAQIIVQGKALTHMEASAFQDYKEVAMGAVLESYGRLKQKMDFIIVEGAGSPAEINLRENDIANMGFAEVVDCPVIIVADIDRGGVFAHLVGTLALLSEPEQQRVQGFIINRFRGDIGLLQPGLDWLEEKTQKPVCGVIPYLTNFYLDAEDAIKIEPASSQQKSNPFTIVVPVLPRISNHTDFDALQLHPQIHLVFAAPGQPLPPADLIILPGSKNVRGDLAALREYGWESQLQRHLRYGGKLIGICGGYQMLGTLIADPDGVEDSPGETAGLGLLETTTLLQPEKTLLQVSGTLLLDPNDKIVPVSGYEIHCGVTTFDDEYKSLITLNDGRKDGVINPNSQIIGTYLHGLFDTPSAATALLRWAGFDTKDAVDLNAHREQQLERLADCLEASMTRDFLDNLAGSVKTETANYEAL